MIDYFNQEYGSEFKILSKKLPDILAVKAGVKPVFRMMVPKEDFNKLEVINPILEKEGVLIGKGRASSNYPYSDEGSGYLIYLSKSESLIENAKAKDPKFNPKNIKDGGRSFGSTLGYPECCINNFFEIICGSRGSKEHIDRYFKSTVDFRLNIFLRGKSKYYLIPHFPCSWNCKKSIEYAKRVFEAIRSYNKEYADIMKKMLTTPILVLFSSSKSIFETFDSKNVILFEGGFENGSLAYRNFQFFLKPSSSHTNELLQLLEKGNKVDVKDGELIIRRNNKTIERLPHFIPRLIRFKNTLKT